tara:strand:+ start:2205 stop:2564 length:360 start_codon:yes stop_codon:yes gene_type:complete
MLKSPITANLIAQSKLKTVLKNAALISADPDSNIRNETCECKACFYLTRGNIVMQAFTKSICESCGDEITFPNSRKDALCLGCAQNNSRCKHCGGNIDTDLPRAAYQMGGEEQEGNSCE